MIGRLTGRILRRHPDQVLVDVGGVGYKVSIPLSTFCALPPEGEALTSLEIHTVVRDDAILLYGFQTEDEKTVFEALLSVSGVGPKVGLAILSGLLPIDIARAVETGDAPRLKSIPGVGKKLAERIVLELKEKIAKLSLAEGPARVDPLVSGDQEAESALIHLGYGSSEARSALDKARGVIPAAGVSLEVLLREALRILAH